MKHIAWIVAVPVAAIVLLAGFGALHGVLEQDCQIGIGSFCGPGGKARAYAVLLGVPVVIIYYVVLALVALIRSRS